MATYSSNTTIKFVSSQSISASGTTTSYTVPAGHFAIVSAASSHCPTGSGSASTSIGSVTLTSTTTVTPSFHKGDVHAPEGTVITAYGQFFANTSTVIISLFTNTP